MGGCSEGDGSEGSFCEKGVLRYASEGLFSGGFQEERG